MGQSERLDSRQNPQRNHGSAGKYKEALTIRPVEERAIRTLDYGLEIAGVMEQPADGEEKVFQCWCGLWWQGQALTVLNRGNYGVDFLDGTMGLSLLHSAVYSAHPIGDRPLLVQDRMLPYMDQGERHFSFRLQGGEGVRRRELVGNEAVLYQEVPMVVLPFLFCIFGLNL